MTHPTPADVAGHRPPAAPPKVDLPAPDADDDLPEHLRVIDDVEEILDLVGPRTGTAPAPKVTVHLAHNDAAVQRRVMRELLTWEGAEVSFPTPGGRPARALVKVLSVPQISVAFDAAAVAHSPAPAYWALDEDLLPKGGQS